MNIYEEIEKHLLTNSTVNVVIAGATCSGKTTLANAIKNYFNGKYAVAIVSQDDYFKNLLDIPRSQNGALTDCIEAFHAMEFKRDVEKLLVNRFVTTPEYDITSNTRICKSKIVRSGTINIFEGLHTIELLCNLDNCIKVYLDTDISICLKRRIERDTKKFGIPEKRIREYWIACISPMCEQYIFPQKKSADIILIGKGGNFYGN